jgi:hypothetical protein
MNWKGFERKQSLRNPGNILAFGWINRIKPQKKLRTAGVLAEIRIETSRI